MKKGKKKKRKLRIGRLFLLLLIITVISFACMKLIDVPIMSIAVSGNNILSDQEVIQQAKLDDYPSFFSTFTFSIKKEIKKNPYVKDAKVSKGLLNIKIKITEKKVLYVDKNTGDKVMINGFVNDDKTICVPYLINSVPEEKKEEFIKAMSKLNKDILCQMSEIKYDPNEIDIDRYYVYMNDGNSVYLTVNKFKKLNKYNTILENVGKQNGTIYLDYGDYFQAK